MRSFLITAAAHLEMQLPVMMFTSSISQTFVEIGESTKQFPEQGESIIGEIVVVFPQTVLPQHFSSIRSFVIGDLELSWLRLLLGFGLGFDGTGVSHGVQLGLNDWQIVMYIRMIGAKKASSTSSFVLINIL